MILCYIDTNQDPVNTKQCKHETNHLTCLPNHGRVQSEVSYLFHWDCVFMWDFEPGCRTMTTSLPES